MADNIVNLAFTNDQFTNGNGSRTATYSGSISIDYTNLTFNGNVSVTDSAGTNTFPTSGTLIDNGNGTYQLNVGGMSTGYEFTLGWAGQTPTSGSANYFDYTHGLGYANGQYGGPDPAQPITSTSVVCFRSGTLIRTARGDVAVENLQPIDQVVTASGERRSIKWLGHRTIDCRRHPRPQEVSPVRIAAHAFCENRPSRDLYVSPGHSVCVDVLGEVLIPATCLINGTTIQQVELDEVAYWHVELDSHDILLAENLPAESYLEMDNRGFFAEGGVVALGASPDAPTCTHADFCRPFVDGGPVLDAVRAQLRRRAETVFGWTLTGDAFGGLHLVVDGQRIEADVSAQTVRFVVPAGAQTVCLVSDTATPRDLLAGSMDGRRLGVCVGRLTIDDGLETRREVGADDERLCVGFHDCEKGVQRWTTGRALLPNDLWAGCRGTFFLRIDLGAAALPHWVAPSVGLDHDTLATRAA